MRMLSEGKIDAFMAFPPEPQELRAKKIGHVLVNTAIDRPWSHYFCCTVAANRDFVRKAPGRHNAGAARCLESRRCLRT
jgi:NitT/TauT family transport system substrate-binding protein